ncbi:MAG: cytochrome c maturation protein CcmE [Firmicutes bacterium]|nr:cytochrome c maturation protein CcmE [Bacillota bacterium]
MSNKKVKIVILSLLPVLLLGLLAFRAFENSATYYYTISEANALEGQEQKLRIKGQLVDESVNYSTSIPLLEFSLTDQESRIDVVYQGVLPDNFHHADEVIVEGKFNSQGQFVVSKLMLQCPSKYEGEE